MMKEHCVFYGCDTPFVTTNYNVKTTPKFEWTLTVDGENKTKLFTNKQPYHDQNIQINREHGRKFRDIAVLLADPRSQTAGLRRPEVISIVMYTGPMAYRFPGGLLL